MIGQFRTTGRGMLRAAGLPQFVANSLTLFLRRNYTSEDVVNLGKILVATLSHATAIPRIVTITRADPASPRRSRRSRKHQ